MNSYLKVTSAVVLALASLFARAEAAAPPAPPAQAPDPVATAIAAKLHRARPDIEYGEVKPSVIAGFYEVPVIGGPVLYVNAAGTHFIAGDMFVLKDDGFYNIAEQARASERKALLAQVPEKDMIVFAPEKDKIKATLTVFTDVDCGYCRKFHSEVPELNRLGIAVHYLAFPRAGLGSDSYRKIATAWCSKDPKDTLTRYKKGESIPTNVCEGNPVARELALGERVGVRGTPALVLEDGTLVPGYKPAAELAQMLGIK